VEILLIALGSHGDVHPFCGIGRRLRQRGHQVTVAANEYFKPLVESVGLNYEPLGSAALYRRMATDPSLWSPVRSIRTVFQGGAMAILQECYALALRYGVERGAVVAASSLALGARVAQDKHHIPLASVHLQPTMFRSAHAAPRVGGPVPPGWLPMPIRRAVVDSVDPVLDLMIGPALNRFRRALGLPRVRGILKDWIHSPQRVIGLFPEWFAPIQPDWPAQTRLAGFPLYDEIDVTPMPAALEAFLGHGDPPIAFTPGSAMWNARRFFESSARACARLGRRGLLLTRHPDHVPAHLPREVIHVSFAPFSALLPRCAAFVHHGGIGSSAQALASGVRQLVMPFTHDQPDNADRLKRLGVAEVIRATTYSELTAAAALKRLLRDDRIAARCARMRQRATDAHAIDRACDLIEQLRDQSPP
jgi:UDP:flavonoid glycosyltransferase YjiC (YdhE family)